MEDKLLYPKISRLFIVALNSTKNETYCRSFIYFIKVYFHYQFVLSFIAMIMSIQYTNTLIFTINSIIVSISSLFYAFLALYRFKQLDYLVEIAIKIGQVVQTEQGKQEINNIEELCSEEYIDLNDQQVRRRLKIVQSQIYDHLQKKNCFQSIIYYIFFIWNQANLIFGVVLLFTNSLPKGFAQYIIYVLLLQFVAYIWIYLGIALFICIVLPIFLIVLCITTIINYKKKKLNAQQFDKVKKIQKYDNVKYQADSCTICFRNYEKDEQIIELPCYKEHIFHSICINGWIAIQQTCPICRFQFVGEQ